MTGNDVTYTYGTTCTETCIFNDVTLYTNPYLVATDKGYTKHYYAGTERVAARIGDGGLAALTHHVIDYDDRLQEKVDLLFEQSFEQINTRELHGNDLFCIESISNTSNELVCELKEIPEQLHGYAEIDVSNFGDGIYSRLEDRSNGQEPDCYFYHSDHLGSASWITDQHGDAVQHIQYLPYGEPYINQRLSGYNERFTFTGKETDCETGFSYFGARYYDATLLTSFLSIDRYADKYPSLSPYHYCAWKPIRLTDPNGDSAWAINNKWDKRFISQYQQSVANIARGYRERGEQYTCEDFALSVLIDFASQNGLPVTITNGTGIYDARSDKYNDIESFKNDVLKTTGAVDLQSEANTLPTNSPTTGDIIVNRNRDGNGHHIQLVKDVDCDNLFIYQGNSNIMNGIPGSSLVGASNPKSPLYAGKRIELAVYNLKSDYYVNVTTGRSTADLSTEKNIDYRRWNFYVF